jgi:hypothetical protein
LAETTSSESVKGPVKISSDGQIFVGFTPIAASEATKGLKDGDTARITGAWSGQHLVAQEVATENTLPFDKANYISVEGYVKAATADNGARIGAYSAHAAALNNVPDGQRMILSGYLDDNEKIEQEQLRSTSPVPTFIDPPALNDSADKSAPHQGSQDKTKQDDSKHDSDDDKANAAAAIIPKASGDEGHEAEHDTQSNADDKEDNSADEKDDASGADHHSSDGTETEQETEHNDDASGTSEHDNDNSEASDDSAGDTESHDATESESGSEDSADSAASESESTDDQGSADESTADSPEDSSDDSAVDSPEDSSDDSAVDSPEDSSDDSSDHDGESDHESDHEED